MTLYEKLKDEYKIKIKHNDTYPALKKSIIKEFNKKSFAMEVTIEDIYNVSILLDVDLLTIREFYDLFKA